MIIRRQHTANFTTIGNGLFDDERLKADEVGILAYLLSRPHNWEVRRSALMRRWDIGREGIRRIIRNLVRYGYCRAERKRLENGTTFVIYEIRDEPGPELTEDDAKRALALDSSAAATGQIDGETGADHVREDDNPCTGYPSTAGPPTADPSPAYIEDITNTDSNHYESTQKAEREYARAREKHATNLVEFKRRWPTAASDDQTRIDQSWFDLDPAEGEAALGGIGPFIAKLKADKRTTVPAGWKYLKEKRWTLLEEAKATVTGGGYALDSVEAKAIAMLYDVAGLRDFFFKVIRRGDRVYYSRPVPPRVASLAQAPHPDDWPILAHNQAAAWEALLAAQITVQARTKLREGARAPWPWPPSIDGKIYTESTGPPDPSLTEQDMADFK